MSTRPRRDGGDRAAAFYVPDALDLSAYPEGLRDPVGYLLDLIHRKRTRWKADEEGYVRLKAAYLRRVIPRSLWKPLVRCLRGQPYELGGQAYEAGPQVLDVDYREQRASASRPCLTDLSSVTAEVCV